MTVDATKALRYETEFLSGVQANFEAAKGRQFRGSIWQRFEQDEGDRLRALLASNRVYDREKLKSLPANRRLALHGFERRFLFGRRRTGVAIASVLSPLGHYASAPDRAGPAIGLGELIDHVRQLVGDTRVPHIIGVCSPTGFTDEARQAKIEMPNVTVVIVEPGEGGGWRTTCTSEAPDPRVLRIFDPEGANEKIERVRDAIADRGTDLLTGGVSLSAVAERTKLPPEVVRLGFERVAAADPELKLSERHGELLLFRGAPARHQERRSMNVIERIRQLFVREGAEVEKINLLAERRAALAQRRDRIYDDITKLEEREADLLRQGKAAVSDVPRRRLAAQLAQLRKDIARQNTAAAMLNKQIDIISTDIHNLTLIQQGQMASLPDTAELTENAVRAEEMLETLKADADLVSSLETGMEASLTSDEELAILREFQEGEEKSAAAEGAAGPVKPPPARAKGAAPPVREADADKRVADGTKEKARPPDAEPI